MTMTKVTLISFATVALLMLWTFGMMYLLGPEIGGVVAIVGTMSGMLVFSIIVDLKGAKKP